MFDRLKALAGGLWGRLFRNPPKAKAAIALFLVLLLIALASQCRASELWLEVGSTVTRAEAPVIGFAIEWPKAGPTDTDYLLGLHLLGAADGMRNQSALTFAVVDGFGRLDIGLGLCLLHHVDEISGSRGNFLLYLALRGDRYAGRQRHCSNGGQTEDNDGRDFSTLGRRFGASR